MPELRRRTQRSRGAAILSIATLTLTLLIAASASADADTTCTHYASPDGGGDGLSPASPFQIASFWSVAGPGKTLCLLGGTYQGMDSMIQPPGGINGTAQAPITVRALDDGAVTIDGQFQNTPIALHDISWWVFQGFNAKSSNTAVLRFGMATQYPESTLNNIIFRRVVLWDGSFTANWSTVEMDAYGAGHLFEDFAVFGTGRKTFVGGSNTIGAAAGDSTCRRCWFRWEGSSTAGNATLSSSYHTNGFRCENCVVIWTGESLPQTYETTDENGVGCGISRTNFNTPGPACSPGWWDIPFMSDACDFPCNTEILGSLVVVPPGANLTPSNGMAYQMKGRIEGSIKLKDLFIYVDPAQPEYDNLQGLHLENCSYPSDPCITTQTRVADHITSVRSNTRGDYAESEWMLTNFASGAKASDVPSPWTNTGDGANLCYRYENGVRTTQPLWPWPMESRIAAATAVAGSAFTGRSNDCANCSGLPASRRTANVTTDVESLLGSIPSVCKAQ